jgi:hypothetical protein
MQPEGALPYSQDRATGPYPKADESTSPLTSYASNVLFSIILPSTYTVVHVLHPASSLVATMMFPQK